METDVMLPAWLLAVTELEAVFGIFCPVHAGSPPDVELRDRSDQLAVLAARYRIPAIYASIANPS
jgi:hypothetical protein